MTIAAEIVRVCRNLSRPLTCAEIHAHGQFTSNLNGVHAVAMVLTQNGGPLERSKGDQPGAYRYAIRPGADLSKYLNTDGSARNAGRVVRPMDGDKLEALVPLQRARDLVKAKGIQVDKWSDFAENRTEVEQDTEQELARRRAQQEKEAQARRIETETHTRLLKALHAKWKGPLQPIHLREILGHLLNYSDIGPLSSAALGIDDDFTLSAVKDADLARFIAFWLIEVGLEDVGDSRLLAECKTHKIDAKAIRAQVVKDLKPVSAAAAKKGGGK